MSEINHENVLTQLRAALNRNSIQLWVEPYCIDGESNESELMSLANILCLEIMNMKYEYCLIAIRELQNTALDNLKSIDEFNETGIATLKVRVPCKSNGTKLLSFKVKLTDIAQILQEMVATKLEIHSGNVKLIANGKVLDLQQPLAHQGVKNNKQIMALVTENDGSDIGDPYARIKKIRSEAELLLNNKDSGFLAIEDQSGKSIHLPENERRSIIMALLLYEKGRVQLKSERFSDALILFLEADSELQSCPSHLVKTVDNVALLNLDIVWCYLNLKSIMQLPDAEARLKICEDNFTRSYGKDLQRVQEVKGSNENEKCLIARLHLMKGILYFHQNRREEAKALMDLAERAIQELKVDEKSVNLLIEMGYSKSEAVTGLRSSFNSVDGAVNFILDRRQKFKDARKEGKAERNVQTFLNSVGISANPRSVLTLHEMGFPKELCALALQKTNENIPQALNLLQNNQNDLKTELVNIIKPDSKLVEELVSLGFDAKLVESILKINVNDFQNSLDALLEMQNNQEFPQQVMSLMESIGNIASTSSNAESAASSIVKKMEKSLAETAAFDELRNDLDHLDDDDEYLTISLEKEQSFLAQYRNALRN